MGFSKDDKTRQRLKLAVCILAGGLSTRMGRDKSRVRLGKETMLRRIYATARQLGFPVKIIRRDIVRRAGPIGGIYTALHGSNADAVIFLACDMPFISLSTLKTLARAASEPAKALFSRQGRQVGFPFLLKREACLPVVSQQISRSEFSLWELASALAARTFRVPSSRAGEFVNVNTPADLESARHRIARRNARLRNSDKTV